MSLFLRRAILSALKGEFTLDPDAGLEWLAVEPPELNTWRNIAYGNGLFIAVSSNGTNRLMRSVDGVNWTPLSGAESNTWESIAYGDGRFVVRRAYRSMVSDDDGDSWSVVISSGIGPSNINMTYGDGLFVAVGGNTIITSPDGTSWTNRSAPEPNSWRDVAYGDGTYVAVSINGSNRCAYSTDGGETWQSSFIPGGIAFLGVAYGNGVFVAVGNNNGGYQVATSPDGINWTIRTASTGENLASITFGGGLFVALCNNQGDPVSMVSEDGVTWEKGTLPNSGPWLSVAYGDGKFVGVANTSAAERVAVSPPNSPPPPPQSNLCPYNVSTAEESPQSAYVVTTETSPGVVSYDLTQPDQGAGSVLIRRYTQVDAAGFSLVQSNNSGSPWDSIPVDTTGIIGWELDFDLSGFVTSTSPSEPEVSMVLESANYTDYQNGYGEIINAEVTVGRNGITDIGVTRRTITAGGEVSSSNYLISGQIQTTTGRVGIYLNLDTKQVGFTHSQLGDLGYAGDFTSGDFSGQKVIPTDWQNNLGVYARMILSPAQSGSGGAGQAAVIARSQDYQLSYPVGTNDPCGNSLT